ncbi:hypothetical protein CRN52_12855 [Vibrio vulnificus]|uniref:Uncharacterized protein n=1 Tax=Vibrio vulnificus TaxID=672 RepID=A0A2S3R1H5_VIBVL|nr:hypothetical protein CRN52_12855 [Vibrio vulnificus]
MRKSRSFLLILTLWICSVVNGLVYLVELGNGHDASAFYAWQIVFGVYVGLSAAVGLIYFVQSQS